PLIAHRQALQLLPVGAPVEDKVVAPHLVRTIGSVGPRASTGDALAAALLRQLQLGLSPQAMRSPETHGVPVAPEEDRNPSIPIARILHRQLDHPPQPWCVLQRQPRAIAQRTSRHIHPRAGAALRYASARRIRHRGATGLHAYHFFAAISFITSISRSRSATSFLSRPFSPSSCFRRRTSSVPSAPNFLRQL